MVWNVKKLFFITQQFGTINLLQPHRQPKFILKKKAVSIRRKVDLHFK